MNNSILRLRALPLALAMCTGAPVSGAAPGLVDTLRFGDPLSERAHAVQAEASETGVRALGHTARRFLPLAKDDWRGGAATFRLKVRSKGPNYLSVKMWGEDANPNQATLYCDGKQLGYRQASDIDILDQGSKYPVAPGRFHYVTHPLPAALTKGKREIACRLRVTGPIWRYGSEFASFQKPMSSPSRDFYSLIVHGDKMVPLDALQGRAPASPVRAADPTAGQALLEKVRRRIDDEVSKLWALRRAPSQLEVALLAKTFDAHWSAGHGSPKNLAGIVAGIDGMWAQYKIDRSIAYKDRSTPNPGWFGLGLIGQAVKITAPHLQSELDAQVADVEGPPLTRRQALETMLLDSHQWNKMHRRLYTNQSMIKDLYGIWYNNEGLIAIGSSQADARDKLLPLLYESVGLQPWTGSQNALGEPTYAAAEDDARFSVSKHYYQTSRKGLTKELGYVGGYGEVLDWVGEIYAATQPSRDAPGDPKIRAQLTHIARARAAFRYPHWDHEGKRAMRMETAIGWRDLYAPGDIVYAQRPSWDASPLQVALATQDAHLLGYVQQMVEDNQFFPSVELMMKSGSLRATIGLVDVIDDAARLRTLAPHRQRLPMTPGQPDTVFADEENGVVAIKRGDEILYASLYWRANYGISGLARVHHITPASDRTATVALDRQAYQPSGLFYTRPNNPHINGHRFTINYPDDGDVWTGGERQPVASLPPGSRYEPGEDNAHAGRADYYELRYGPYLIAMNSSSNKRFTVVLPWRAKAVKELVSGAMIEPGKRSLVLNAGSTAVIYLGGAAPGK